MAKRYKDTIRYITGGTIIIALIASYVFINKFHNTTAQAIPSGSIVLDNTTTAQKNPAIIHTNNDYAIIAWESWDDVEAYAENNIIKIAKYDYDGAQIGSNIENLVSMSGTNTNIQLYSDGANGAFIVWEYRENKSDFAFDIMVSHLASNGALSNAETLYTDVTGQWSASSVGTYLFTTTVVSNNIVAKTYRSTDGSVISFPSNIYDGGIFPSVTALTRNEAILFWRDFTSYKIYAQRYNESGVAQWNTIEEIHDGTNSPQNLKSVSLGSADDEYIYVSYESGGDLYIDGISNDATTHLTESVVSNRTGLDSGVVLVPTPENNIIVTWVNNGTTTDDDVYYQRYSEDLTPQETVNGIALAQDSEKQYDLAAASDGLNGMFAVWQDRGTTTQEGKMQWIDWEDTAQWGPDSFDSSIRPNTVDQNQFATTSLQASTGAYYGFIAYSEVDYTGADDDHNVWLKIVEFPDTMPPVTSYSVSPDDCSGDSDWCTSGVTVTLSTNEPATTYYCLDCAGAPTTEYTAPFIIDFPTTTTLKFYSDDLKPSSNNEAVVSIPFRFDQEAPTTAISTTIPEVSIHDNIHYFNAPFDISFNPTDTVSGIATTVYSINTTPSAQLEITTDYAYAITYQSTDIAGNEEPLKTVTYFLDTQNPSPIEQFKSDSPELDPTPTFSWNAIITDPADPDYNLDAYDGSPSSGLEEICISIFDDSDTEQHSACVPYNTTSYTVSTPLVSGYYYATAYLKDIATNKSTVVRYPETGTFLINENSSPFPPTLEHPVDETTPGDEANFDTITFDWTYEDPIDGDPQQAYQLKIVDTSTTPVTTHYEDTSWVPNTADSGTSASITLSSMNTSSNTLTPLEIGTTYQWAVRVQDNPSEGFTKESNWSTYANFTTNRRPDEPTFHVDTPVSTDKDKPTVVPANSHTFSVNGLSDPDGHVPLEMRHTIGTYNPELNNGAGGCENYASPSAWQSDTGSLVLSSIPEFTQNCLTLESRDFYALTSAPTGTEYFYTYDEIPTVSESDISFCTYDTDTGSCIDTLAISPSLAISNNHTYKLSVTAHDANVQRIETILDDVVPLDGVGVHLAGQKTVGFFYKEGGTYYPIGFPTGVSLEIGDITLNTASYSETANSMTVNYIFTINNTWTQTEPFAVNVLPMDTGSFSSNDIRDIPWSSFGSVAVDIIAPDAPTNLDFLTSIDGDGMALYNSTVYSSYDTEIYASFDEIDPAGNPDLDHYEIAVGTEGNIDDVLPWEEFTGTGAEIDLATLPTLSNHTVYELSVRAVDHVGNVSLPLTGKWTTDLDPPELGDTINDGTYTNVNTDVTFSIDGAFIASAGILKYEYNIVTDTSNIANTSVIGGWQTTTDYPSITHTVSLADGQYFVVVKATNNVNKTSAIAESDGFIIDTVNEITINPLVKPYVGSNNTVFFGWTYDAEPTSIQYDILDSSEVSLVGGWKDDITTTAENPDMTFSHDVSTDGSSFTHGETYILRMRTFDFLGNDSIPPRDVTFTIDSERPDAPLEAFDIYDLTPPHIGTDIDYSNKTTLSYVWQTPTPPNSGIYSFMYNIFEVTGDTGNENYTPLYSAPIEVVGTGNTTLELPGTYNQDTKYAIGLITVSNSGNKSSELLNDGQQLNYPAWETDVNNDKLRFSDGLLIDRIPATFNDITLGYRLRNGYYYSESNNSLLDLDWSLDDAGAPTDTIYLAIGKDAYPNAGYDDFLAMGDTHGNLYGSSPVSLALTNPMDSLTPYYLTLEATDVAGNVSLVTMPNPLIIDTSPPENVDVYVEDTDYVQQINGNYFTNNTSEISWHVVFTEDSGGFGSTGLYQYQYIVKDADGTPVINNALTTDQLDTVITVPYAYPDSDSFTFEVTAENLAGGLSAHYPSDLTDTTVYIDRESPTMNSLSLRDKFTYDTTNYNLYDNVVDLNYSGSDDTYIDHYEFQLLEGDDPLNPAGAITSWLTTTDPAEYSFTNFSPLSQLSEQEYYHIAGRAVDYFGNISNVEFSEVFLVDTESPSNLVINSNETRYINSPLEITSEWEEPYNPNDIPIDHYEVAFGPTTYPDTNFNYYSFDGVNEWLNVAGTDTSIVVAPVSNGPLAENTDYFMSIRAIDIAHGFLDDRFGAMNFSPPIHTDFTAPTKPDVFFNGEYYFMTNGIEGRIKPSTDNIAGIAGYEYAIGTDPYPSENFDSATSVATSGCEEEQTDGWWQYASIDSIGEIDGDGNADFFFNGCINMQHGGTYYLTLRAIDKANNKSEPGYTINPITIDTTPPVFVTTGDQPTQVYNDSTKSSYLFTINEPNGRTFTNNPNSFYLEYDANDDESGINTIELSIYDNTSDTTHLDWVNLPVTSLPGQTTINQPPLQEGNLYTVRVKATNYATNSTTAEFPLILDTQPPVLDESLGDYVWITSPYSSDDNLFRFVSRLSDNPLDVDVTAGIVDYKIAAGTATYDENGSGWYSKTHTWIPESPNSNIQHVGSNNREQVFSLTYNEFDPNELKEPLEHGENIYATLKARDRAFNEAIFSIDGPLQTPSSSSRNGPTLIDITPPTVPSQVYLLSEPFVSEITSLNVEFLQSEDPESGIYRYEYSLYNKVTGEYIENQKNVRIRNYRLANDRISFTIDDLNLSDGSYEVWIRAVNRTYSYSENQELSYSDYGISNPVIIDSTPPSAPSGLKFTSIDGLARRYEFTNVTNKARIRYRDAEDNESGITKYSINYGYDQIYSEGTSELISWQDYPGSSDNTLMYNNINLIHGGEYYAYMKATNGAGLESPVAVSNLSLKVDTVKPTNIQGAYEGEFYGNDSPYDDENEWNNYDFWGSEKDIPYGWKQSTDTDSGMDYYLYKITYSDKRDSSYDDFTNWIKINHTDIDPEVMLEGATYIDGFYYRVEVKGYDKAGNVTSVKESDSILVDSSPPTTPYIYMNNTYTYDPNALFGVGFESEDPQSEIDHYNVYIENGDGVMWWPTDDKFREYPANENENINLDLSDKPLLLNDKYYLYVTAVNKAGVLSEKGKSSAIKADTTAPIVTVVSDPDSGTEYSVMDEGVTTNSRDILTFYFNIEDEESSPLKYYYALGTSPSYTDDNWNSVIGGTESVTVFESAGDTPETFTGFRSTTNQLRNLVLNIPALTNGDFLDEGETYYLHLIVKNTAGLTTPFLVTDGITVDNSAPLTMIQKKVLTTPPPPNDLFNKHIDLYFNAHEVADFDDAADMPDCEQGNTGELVRYQVKFDSEEIVTIPPYDMADLDGLLWDIKVNNKPLDTTSAIYDTCIVTVAREDFAENSHVVTVQAYDESLNFDATPATFTWRVGESMNMYSTNWFTQDSMSTSHRQTTVPNGKMLVVSEYDNGGDTEIATDQIYRMVVGPQSFTSATISTARNGNTLQTSYSEFQAPLSIRPRSLLGVEIPDLVLSVSQVAGEMIPFNLTIDGPDGKPISALLYDETDQYLINQATDNFNFDADTVAGDWQPFQLKDNTGQPLPEETEIIVVIPDSLRNGEGLPDNTLRINAISPEHLGEDPATQPITPELFNTNLDTLYSTNTIPVPLAGWDEDAYEIVPMKDEDTGKSISQPAGSNYFIDKLVNLDNMSYGTFCAYPCISPNDKEKFKLTEDGLFNFALPPMSTKVAGKRLMLELLFMVRVPSVSDDEAALFFPMKPVTIVLNVIEPNTPSMLYDENTETGKPLAPGDTTTITIDDPTTLTRESNCSDGIDDDADGVIDCYDSDCSKDPSCTQ